MAGGVAFEVDEGRAVRDDVLHVLHIGDIEPGIKTSLVIPFAIVNQTLLFRPADVPTASLFPVVHEAAPPGPSLAAAPWLSDVWD
jgi:hypothetical protein